jgi:hypothetical protein
MGHLGLRADLKRAHAASQLAIMEDIGGLDVLAQARSARRIAPKPFSTPYGACPTHLSVAQLYEPPGPQYFGCRTVVAD